MHHPMICVVRGAGAWCAYHASLNQTNSRHEVDNSSLLPLFRDGAHSVAIIRHAMNIIKYVKPGQGPEGQFNCQNEVGGQIWK